MNENTKVQRQQINAKAAKLFEMSQRNLWDYDLRDKIFELSLDLPKMPGRPKFEKLGERLDAEESKKLYEQELDAFYEAFEAAVKCYKGEGSFVTLLYNCYGKKKLGCQQKYFEETQGKLNQKLKEQAVKDCIKNLATARGLKLSSKDLDFNVLNMDKLEDFLWKQGFSYQEIDCVVECAISDYVCHDEVVGENGEETWHLSDGASLELYNRQAQEQLVQRSVVEEALRRFEGVEKGHILKLVLTYYAHLKWDDEELRKYVLDQDLFDFLKTHKSFPKVTDAITAFLEKKDRETIRKDVAIVKKGMAPKAPKAPTAETGA